MKQKTIIVPPQVGFDEEKLGQYLHKQHIISKEQFFRIERRSVDARKKNVKVNLSLAIDDKPLALDFVEYHLTEKNVGDAPCVIIVGAGPAGLFAAIKAIDMGVKPIVIERGKDVRARRRDLAAINKEHIVNPDSNYCFGEGGAGTYSDGKLYTRSKKRGSVRRIYEILVAHGATEEILYESHPHIGTNKLPKLVAALRETVLEHGGEIHFEKKVTGFILQNGEMKGVELHDGEKINGEAVVLATGHSARDIFRLCKKQHIKIEAKPFALGVRLEHPQQLIDQIQYSCESRGEYLPAAAYSLVHQTTLSKKERGVFSFCMCPGGFIVPAATAPGELVVNGMSPSRRNSRFANSGIVAAVELHDIPSFHQHEELAAMEFQASVERKAWELGGKTQASPAQRMTDFVNRKVSPSLNDTSYQPGLASTEMREVLPHFIAERLAQGLRAFGKKMRGYMTEEAQLIGVESRTSSPVRIPRHRENCEHTEIKRFFPCGEGAGYAGGIVSAAMDGERCVENAIRKYLLKN